MVDLFKSREGWLLFITYPPILGSYIKYSTILESPKHTYKIISFLFCFKFGLQPCQYLFHHFPELHQKSKHFWTFPNLTSYSNHLNLNQMSLNLIFQSWPFYFSRNKLIFASPEKLSPCPTSSPNPSFFSFLSLFCFYFL